MNILGHEDRRQQRSDAAKKAIVQYQGKSCAGRRMAVEFMLS
jgi:hypothetical protein